MRQNEDWDDDFPEEEHCLLCGGIAFPLGSLGKTLWYRCQDCGRTVHESEVNCETKT